jgi:hypothetical protein
MSIEIVPPRMRLQAGFKLLTRGHSWQGCAGSGHSHGEQQQQWQGIAAEYAEAGWISPVEARPPPASPIGKKTPPWAGSPTPGAAINELSSGGETCGSNG